MKTQKTVIWEGRNGTGLNIFVDEIINNGVYKQEIVCIVPLKYDAYRDISEALIVYNKYE